jgi:hypothetical protein
VLKLGGGAVRSPVDVLNALPSVALAVSPLPHRSAAAVPMTAAALAG